MAATPLPVAIRGDVPDVVVARALQERPPAARLGHRVHDTRGRDGVHERRLPGICGTKWVFYCLLI